MVSSAYAVPPVADFSGSPTTGVEPLTVTFTDLSTGVPTSWSWDFNNDTVEDSTLQNPSFTYNTPGTYTVSLTATNGEGSDTETKIDYITVTDAPPVADFSGSPTTGVEALTVDFTDLSTGNVTGWSWDFENDGTPDSTLQNPSHTYNTAGTYTVKLTATSPGGSDIETKIDYIAVTDAPPVADFSGSPTTGVEALTVDFTDLSTGNVTGWSWDFENDGTPDSTLQNPSHTYNTAGTYTVKLTATGPGGSDIETKIDYITVTDAPPVADFSGSPTTGVEPLTVDFTDLSTGNVTGWSWDFENDGTPDSTLQNPSHTYNTAGTYTVKLTATGPGGADIETKIDYITVTDPPPVADFSGSPTTGVKPLTVDFTDLSSGNVTGWSWDFENDGIEDSTLQNPSHTYNTAGTYTVKLTATGPGGSDIETKIDYITVTDPPPVADFSGSPTTGVEPLTVDFTDLSTGNVTGWSWDFENDGIEDSTLQNPSHTYNTAGTYTVKLTATGPGGSDIETKTDYIIVYRVADFSATPTTGGEPLTVNFTDLSSGGVTGWSWDFENDGIEDSTLQNPTYTYSNAGTYTVKLTVTGPGPSDTEIKTDYITVNHVADFSATPTTGAEPLTVNFTDLSSHGVTGWSWDFENDGIEDSTLQNPSHTYNTTGTYTVKLTATGPAGSDVETKIDYITVTDAPPVADFSGSPTTGAGPLTVTFTDLSSGNVTGWSWDFENDGTEDSTLQNPSHTYNTTGTYTVKLTATGPAGSDIETKIDYITVTDAPPVADFSGSPTTGAEPLTVTFTDLSTGVVTGWSWDFENDGTSDSTLQNPSHTYNTTGTYTVKLIATGPTGSDIETKIDYITVSDAPPVADFSATPTTGVEPLTVTFTDVSTGVVTGWSWDFENDGIEDSTLQNPSHTYNTAGTYTVKLTATGPGGSDIETKIDYITVTDAPPVAEFSGSPTTGGEPLTVTFTDVSTGVVTGWSWDFENDGIEDSTLQNPSHTYNAAGTYTVKFTATGPGGSDTEIKTDYITVNHVADFSATPTTGGEPLIVTFTDLSSGNVTGWSWDFENDGIEDSTLQNPTYTYSNAGTYTVKLTVTGPGPSDTEIKTDYITVNHVADFSATPTTGVEPLTVTFTDLSSGGVTGWSWDFETDGIEDSTLQNPSHTYNTAGTYTVKLIATGPGGSDKEKKIDYITVTDAPPVADFSGSPTSGGAPLTVNFTDLSTGNVTEWSWDFENDGVEDSTEQNPTYTYNGAGTYTVKLVATGPGGSDIETKAGYITVNHVADFSASPTTGDEPLTVTFTDLSTGGVTGWSWDFENDGIEDSTLQNPTHTYGNAGTYTVKLTATGPGGSDTEIKTDYIIPAHKADFSATATSGSEPLTVTFTDLSTHTVTGWSWDFENDGVEDSTEQNPTHTYNGAGTYTVKLTVTGPGGSDTEKKIGYITVHVYPWAYDYGGSGYDRAHSIQQTFDAHGNPDAYIVAGETSSFGAGNKDVWVAKLDPSASVIWEKTYGDTGDETACGVQQTSDGGYVVAGHTDSFSHSIWVLKLHSDGAIVWQKTYGGWLETGATCLQETSDGGYILAGDWDNGARSSDIWVLKLDSTGTVGWQKTYGTGQADSAVSLRQTSDDGYILAANRDDGLGNAHSWVLKLGSSGTVDWSKTYSLGTISTVGSIQQTSDSGYIVAGSTDFFGTGTEVDYWVLKLNPDGSIVWQKAYGLTDSTDEHAHAVQQTSDGGYIVVGDGITALRLDSNGARLWEKTYGGAGDDSIRSVEQTRDGAYILAGFSDSFGSYWTDDMFVLRLNSAGEIPNCQIMTTSASLSSGTGGSGENRSYVAGTSLVDVVDTNVTPQDSLAEISMVCSSIGTEAVVIKDAYTCNDSGVPQTVFAPKEPIQFHVVYDVLGNPGTQYKVKALINIFGRTYEKKALQYPGTDYVLIKDRDDGKRIKVPYTAAGKIKTIVYKLKLKLSGELLDKEKTTSQFTVTGL
ncbi:MAG: PKD domain-containing protein [Thermodesulfobacteriota bacterium]|nr:PKD domain-containing protein [Thermodesulfobacteriota bacterium]